MRGLRSRIQKLEAKLRRKDAPTLREYLDAVFRERPRNLVAAKAKLRAVAGGDDPESAVEPPDEQQLRDRDVIERYERENGGADIAAEAVKAKAKLLDFAKKNRGGRGGS